MPESTRKNPFVLNEDAFEACVDDVLSACQAIPAVALPDSSSYDLLTLKQAVRDARKDVAPIYQGPLVNWFLGWLGNAQNHLGEAADDFRQLRKMSDAKGELFLGDQDKLARLRHVFNTANAILQKGDREYPARAFQEVVADLYDGFLSAQDREGASPPKGVLPAFVSWKQKGSADTVSAGEKFEKDSDLMKRLGSFKRPCGLIRMPAAFGKGGLLAWAVLGHETLGHDMTAAYPSVRKENDDLVKKGLEDELVEKVGGALRRAKFNDGIADFWTERIEETASDVLGILNMGPAAALGMLGYFRGSNESVEGGERKLSRTESERYAPDVVRGYLWAATVDLLKTDRRTAWADAIRTLTAEDAGNGDLEVTVRKTGSTLPLSLKKAEVSAAVVARAVADSGSETLGKSILEIQNWSDKDERFVDYVWNYLVEKDEIPPWARSGMYAAHVVAGAVEAALTNNGTPQQLLEGMTTHLESMYQADTTWGPLSGPPESS